MDVGAAAYLCVNGLSDGRPGRAGPSWRSVLSLLLLGGVRLVSLPALNYQQHASEYGRHVNFFFVLAFVKVAGAPPLRLPPALLPFFSAFLSLVQLGVCRRLLPWLLAHSHSDGLVAANKESVAAACGHLALYCWAAAVGRGWRGSRNPPLALLGGGAASAGAVAVSYGWLGLAISRQLSNAPFLAWTMLLLHFMLLSSAALAALASWSRAALPVLCQALSRHMLAVFLAANLLTGLLNLLVDMLALSDGRVVLLVGGYTAVLCAGAVCWDSIGRAKYTGAAGSKCA